MYGLTKEDMAQLKVNGADPDADHWPVRLLKASHGGETVMSFMLTHVEPERPAYAYCLADFGHGKPRRAMVHLRSLFHPNPLYRLNVEAVPDFVPEYPISVYEKAAKMLGYMTTGRHALKYAEYLLAKQQDAVIRPLRPDHHNPDEPGFIPLPLPR